MISPGGPVPGEFDYIRRLRGRIPSAPGVIVGPGDDCAVLARPLRNQLVTTDLLQDGVDFLLAACGPVAAGRKAMAVNLSDVAAMAGVPTAAVVGLCLPRTGGPRVAEGVFEGVKAVADEFGVAIVGGDTNSWDGPLVIAVTLLGEVTNRGPVRRNGAKPGDGLFVTGPLGGSLLGRHLSPRPRVREALALHAVVDLRAMIDISDGLAADVSHLCEESRCGVELDADAIPIHPDAVARGRATGRTPLWHALNDGEDFELAFAVNESDGLRLIGESPVEGIRLSRIGTFVPTGVWLRERDGVSPLSPEGWEHAL
jgi:thiamine-monophosphate kinase